MLNHKIAIYVPSTKNGNQPAPELASIWRAKAQEKFAKLFGGFTEYAAKGGWWSDDHGLIQEDIAVVVAFAGDLKKVYEVREFAILLQQAMGQECVSLEVDNTLEFVSAQAESATMTG